MQSEDDCFGNAEKYKDIYNRPPDIKRLVETLAVEAFGVHVIPSFFTYSFGFRASIMPNNLG